MNFPTALQYLRRGAPVARSSWAGGDGKPARWWTYHAGILWVNEATRRAPIGLGDVTEADLLARDWVLPPSATADLPELPDFPWKDRASSALLPLFDVNNPPARL